MTEGSVSMSAETLIRNGTVVHDWGQEVCSIAIADGRIVGIFPPGQEPEVTKVIDATGRLVLPGAVDMHSHHREPGFEHKENIASVTQACAAGGVTTTVAMPNVQPPPNTSQRLEDLFARYDERAVVDYNVNPAATVLEEIPRLAEMGVAAFKIFMVVDTGRDYPHMPGIGVHDHGELMAIMEACASAGVPLMVHPHDQALMDHIEEQYWARGERDALAYARAYAAHDGLIWETAIATLLRMQQATGVHLHLLHVQTAGTVDMIRQAKARGAKVTAEINPWALFLGNDWANIERLGSYALSYWVPEHNTPVLWEALRDGTIDIIATDHAPHTRDEKEVGWEDGWKAHTGTPSTQFYLPMFLTAAKEGKISLERLVAATSTRPAELFALEAKGRIAVGRDADLVIVDTEASHVITDDEVISQIDWTPYAGVAVTALPVRTLVRGVTVFADGQVLGKSGHGQLAAAHRKTSTAV